MPAQHSPQATGDKTKQALMELCQLLEQYPDKNRQELLHMVEIQFDLTPKECLFLDKNFDDDH